MNEENQELDLDSLSKRIAEIKEGTDKRFSEMQAQIDELKKTVDQTDDKVAKRLFKITNLINNAFDNFQQIMLTIGDITERINANEQRGMVTANSAAINKKNLQELSKYLKKADKSWQEAIKEINDLKDSVDKDKKVQWKTIIAVFVGLCCIIYLLKGGNATELFEFFFKLLHVE